MHVPLRVPQPTLFPFGHGLSYTTFSYERLKLSKSTIGQNDILQLSVDVRNTGSVAAAEVVQIYVRDLEASVHRPSLELRDFSKVHLSLHLPASPRISCP